VVWPDNVENDGQRDTVVDNWRQSAEAKKTKKNPLTTLRQTKTLVRQFSDMMYLKNVKTTDRGKLLWATVVSHQKREKNE